MERMPYWAGLGTALSQFLHALIGGHPDMSLSARAHLSKHHRAWWYVWIVAEMLFGEGHCSGAWASDAEYAEEVLRIEQEGLK